METRNISYNEEQIMSDEHKEPNAGNVIADLCEDPTIAEEVKECADNRRIRDILEYIYAISHNIAQKAREGKEVNVLDVMTRIEFFAKEAIDSPLRNYEVGTIDEQGTRYLNQFVSWCSGGGGTGMRAVDAILKWAQMPYGKKVPDEN